MRREGFELQVSKPEVIIKVIDDIECEPYEEVQIDVPDEYLGNIMQTLGERGGELTNMTSGNGQTRLNYITPSRSLIGFMTNFLTMTKGYGIINHTFYEYRPLIKGSLGERKQGVLVSTEHGFATGYALQHIEERGTMFISPGTEVYEGMIVGEHHYTNDLAVNPVNEKNLTNMRAAGSDKGAILKTPRRLSLEACLDYINSDELVEVTPTTFRMRKKILDTVERKKYDAHRRALEKEEK